MKKSALLTIIIPLLFLSLTGCDKNSSSKEDNKIHLTYGNKMQTTVESLKELSTAELYEKAYNEKETFLLAVHQGKYSEDCLCWSTFKSVIVNYMGKTNEIIYLYNAQEQDESIANLKITKYEDSTPALYIFDGTNKIASFSYRNNEDRVIFENLKCEEMKKRIHEYVKYPQLYYNYPEYILHNTVKYHSSLAVLFIRSGCGDCQYVIPNIILPYIKTHELKAYITIIDLQELYDLSKDETASEERRNEYQATKEYCKLTENMSSKYGYLNGVVPTMQYYKAGSLEDSSVFFNDEIAKKDDGSYYISNSFYTSERLTSIKYASNVKNNVLKGMEISKEDVITTTSGYTYWSQEKAAEYHTPLLTAFLDYYCL